MGASMAWRSMAETDLGAVAEIARIAFPNHFEGRAVFANRLSLHPEGCFVLAGPEGRVWGYLVAYPWRRGQAPTLNGPIEAIPDDADLLYLHDLAMAPEARGRGWTRPIVETVADQARRDGWPAVGLVAVNDAQGFWRRQGFSAEDTPATRRSLKSYGPDATYMVRPV